jgi:hypothetical protein
VTTADLIAAAVLFGPAVIAFPALAYRVLAGRRDTAAVAAVLDELRAQDQAHATGPNTPTDGVAPVIPLNARRHAA